MTTEMNGTEAETAANPDTGHQSDPATETQNSQGVETQVEDTASFLTDLPEGDTRTWLEKRGITKVEDLAKTAHEQSKLLGNAVRVPGKDAKPEEVEAFYEKLGRPKTADEYGFKPPESLPEGLPYDGERAKAFAAIAHKHGLSKAQAAALHDWFTGEVVSDFNGAVERHAGQEVEVAKAETEKLVKLWGPLDGEAMRTNLAFADKVMREVGGEEALKEFQRVGLIGEQGAVIKSAPIAVMLSRLGAALYKEDTVLRGRADRIGNPFAEGNDHNVTAQMKIVKEDREHALALIAAAGKKPEDFGLKG